DGHVTGVQTCALPIYATVRANGVDPARAVSLRGAARGLVLGGLALGMVAAPAVVWPDPFGTLARRFLIPWAHFERVGRFVVSVRSEERRVGKEWRCGG